MLSSRPPTAMRASTLRALHDLAAASAGAPGGASEEAREYRRKLLFDIGEREELPVQAVAARSPGPRVLRAVAANAPGRAEGAGLRRRGSAHRPRGRPAWS